MYGNHVLGKISVSPVSNPTLNSNPNATADCSSGSPTTMVSIVATGNSIADTVPFRLNGTSYQHMYYSSRGNVQLNSSGYIVAPFPIEDGVVPAGNSTVQPVVTIGKSAAPQMMLRMSTYSNLGTPLDGAIVPCSDCAVTKPCAGGGAGALAKRINSVWICN